MNMALVQGAVSPIGFTGAGLIFARRGAIRVMRPVFLRRMVFTTAKRVAARWR
ncbi:MAG: hypothetical protein ACRDOU_22460 [Streptosporangiaceae bacterium]